MKTSRCLVFKPSPLYDYFLKLAALLFTELLLLEHEDDRSVSSGLPTAVICHFASELSNQHRKGKRYQRTTKNITCLR